MFRETCSETLAEKLKSVICSIYTSYSSCCSRSYYCSLHASHPTEAVYMVFYRLTYVPSAFALKQQLCGCGWCAMYAVQCSAPAAQQALRHKTQVAVTWGRFGSVAWSHRVLLVRLC